MNLSALLNKVTKERIKGFVDRKVELIRDIPSDIAQIPRDIKRTELRRRASLAKITKDPEAGFVQKAYRLPVEGALLILDSIGDILIGAGKAVLTTPKEEKAIAKGFETMIGSAIESKTGQRAIKKVTDFYNRQSRDVQMGMSTTGLAVLAGLDVVGRGAFGKAFSRMKGSTDVAKISKDLRVVFDIDPEVANKMAIDIAQKKQTTKEIREIVRQGTKETLELRKTVDTSALRPARTPADVIPDVPVRPVEVKPLEKVETPITKELEPLAREARKFKTAEEFVEAEFTKPKYGMGHRPSHEGMPPSHNLLKGETLPRDVYTKPDFSIASGRIRTGDKAANESWDALQKIKGKPNAEITIYRASPKNELNAGDWVTFSKEYAKQSVEGVEKVNSFKVKAKDIIFAGDDINEFGYFPKSQLTDFFNKAKGVVDDAPIKKAIPPEKLPVKKDIKRPIKEVDDSPLFKTSTIKNDSPEAIQAYTDTRNKFELGRDETLNQIQDDWVAVRRMVENKKLKIDEAANPYDAEVLFHGRVGTRIEDFDIRIKKIDKDIIKSAKKTNVPDKQFSKDTNDYLIARHAPERNKHLGDGAAGISTKDAIKRAKEIEELPYGKEVIRIADDIQKINNKTLDILKEGEVITDDLYNLLRKRYENHIPLYRIMENEEDFAGVMARGFDVKGTGIKRAVGSDKEISDILGNVAFNYEQAIVRAEKNRVDLSTLKMVEDNKEALKDIFTVRKPKVIGQTWDGKPIRETIIDPRTLVLRKKGKTILIDIADPQLALVLRGVSRQKMSGMMRGVGAITRLYAGLHTRFNPEFAFSNKVRDIQEVLVYASAQGELGGKGAAKVLARELRGQNMKAVTDLIRGVDSEGARLYKQMRSDGGTTGGMGLSTKKQIELDIDKIRKTNRSNPRKAGQQMLEYVDHWNTIFEDSTRLSIYRQALENGASRHKAATLAKESTVNFNKFGKQGQIINALYIFSNASIQGTTKMIRAMKNPKVAAAVSTTVLGAVVAVGEWNDRVDPDWRDKIRTWDRLNSLAIMLPAKEGEGVKYMTIPVSWGIKPIKVMADQIYDLSSGKGEGLAKASQAVLVSILEAYNPVGGTNIVSAITPTILDIPTEVARNQAWHGGRIRPDWDRNAPPSIQYFDSLRDSTTGRTAVGISKGLSGIGIEVSPSDIYYSYNQLIGGVGRTINKTFNTITAVGKGDTPETRDIPVVSRFYKTLPEEKVGSGAKEFEQIASILEEQSREKFYLNQQADDALQQLNEVGKKEATSIISEIEENDPDLHKEIIKIKKQQEKKLTFIDRKILQLGVENGNRAKFLTQKFKELDSEEERVILWQEYTEKGIISKAVAEQLSGILKDIPIDDKRKPLEDIFKGDKRRSLESIFNEKK